MLGHAARHTQRGFQGSQRSAGSGHRRAVASPIFFSKLTLTPLLLCSAGQVHNAGVFASGLLAGGSSYKYGEAPPEVRERARAWEELARRRGLPLLALALAFAFLPAAVTKVAVGFKSAAEVRENVALLATDVPDAVWAEARALGLLQHAVEGL